MTLHFRWGPRLATLWWSESAKVARLLKFFRWSPQSDKIGWKRKYRARVACCPDSCRGVQTLPDTSHCRSTWEIILRGFPILLLILALLMWWSVDLVIQWWSDDTVLSWSCLVVMWCDNRGPGDVVTLLSGDVVLLSCGDVIIVDLLMWWYCLVVMW